MVQDPYGVLADDRINDKLDFNKINSKSDYEKEVKHYLESTQSKAHGNFQGERLVPFIDRMYENSKASEIVEKKQDEEAELLRKAQRLHMKRGKRGRTADEKTTARDTRRATKRNIRTWKRRKYRGVDIRGVDTKRRMKLSQKNLITKADTKLKNIRVGLDKNGIKHYRDAKGRFTKKPI